MDTKNNQSDQQAYKQITEKFVIKSWSANNPQTQSQSQQKAQTDGQQKPSEYKSILEQAHESKNSNQIKALASHTINIQTPEILPMLKKTLAIGIPALPIIILLIAFISFLYEFNFDISLIGQFPQWASTHIEEFVKQSIIPQMNN